MRFLGGSCESHYGAREAMAECAEAMVELMAVMAELNSITAPLWVEEETLLGEAFVTSFLFPGPLGDLPRNLS